MVLQSRLGTGDTHIGYEVAFAGEAHPYPCSVLPVALRLQIDAMLPNHQPMGRGADPGRDPATLFPLSVRAYVDVLLVVRLEFERRPAAVGRDDNCGEYG